MKSIIELAREAGLYVGTNISGVTLVGSPTVGGIAIAHITIEEFERFATLYRAQVLEEAAGVCTETGSIKGSCDAEFDMADACATAIRQLKETK